MPVDPRCRRLGLRGAGPAKAAGLSDGAETGRRLKGAAAYHGGHAAEDQVALAYEQRGYTVAARCWRGPGGEIDLIFRKAGAVIFVEVKRARTHALAAERLSARQRARIMASASAFLAGEPSGQDTEAVFEVALVDGEGRIEIVSNAFV